MKVAGIDVHKKVLMVVVVDTSMPQEKPARRRFVTLPSELQRFRIWLQEQGVEEAVLESTAQYWRGGGGGGGPPNGFRLGAGVFHPRRAWGEEVFLGGAAWW